MAKKKKTKKKATRKKAQRKAAPKKKLEPSSVNEKALEYRCHRPDTGVRTQTRTTKDAALADKKKHEAVEGCKYVLQERTLDGWQDLIS